MADLYVQVRRSLRRVDDAVNPPVEAGILDAAGGVATAAAAVKDKARNGDVSGTGDAADDLVKAARDLLAKTRAAAEAETDPKAKKDLLDAISRLEVRIFFSSNY